MHYQEFLKWGESIKRRCEDLRRADPGGPGSTCYVTCAIDNSRAATQDRTIEAVLSTTNPVARFSTSHVLEHTSRAVDFSRLVDGGLPLLFNHDSEQIIGRAENVRIYESKLRANLRFSKSQKAEEVWQDIVDGITTGISIGYAYWEYEIDEEKGIQTITRWMPHEVSIVAMPADINARVERSLEMGLLSERPAENRLLIRGQELFDLYHRLFDLTAARATENSFHDILAPVREAITSAKSEADADACENALRDAALTFAEERSRANQPSMGIHDYSNQSRESDPMENFSLCRAIAMQFDPGASAAGGPEVEIMRDVASRSGKRSAAKGLIPESAIFTRAVTKGTTGGNLIGNLHLGSEFIPVLRERLITGRMGATLLTGLQGDLQIPKGLTDSSAGWIAGDGEDEVGDSDPTYGKITMSPKTVGVKSTLSRKMLLQGDPASEELLRNSLAFAVSKAIDTACLIGDGTNNVPIGIMNTSGISSETYANGSNPGFGNIVDLEGALMIDNADMGNLGYVTSAAVASQLKQTPIVPAMDTMIWTSDNEGEGRMNGYRSLVSNIVPAGHVVFGNWSDLVIGMWSGFDFTVDPYTRASFGDVVITLLIDVDVAVRHGESFAEIHEAA